MLAKPRKLIAVQWSATKLPNFPPGCLSARWQRTLPVTRRTLQHVEYRGHAVSR